MSPLSSISRDPVVHSKDTITVQWQTAMDRLKHHEALTVTGIGLILAASAYVVHEVLAKANNPTERDYWAAVFVLTVLCVCQLQAVDRVNDTAAGVIELEKASEGRLTYLSNVARRITWTSSFGFLATFVAPVFSVLGIIFEYRGLAANRLYPLIALAVSGLIFLFFALGVLRRLRVIKDGVESLVSKH